MKVVGYLRVSTDKQADEGLGLEVQQQRIKEWATTHGHRITDWVSDEGISGAKDLDDRPGLAEALALVREGRAAGVVVYRLDRLARDLIIQEQLLAEFRRAGGDVFTTSAAEAGYLSDDPDDPSRRLIRQILGAVSEYERAMIALRLRSGRRRKAEKGGFAYGAPAFGQQAVDRELAIEPEEAETVARIVQLRRSGRSYREVVVTLESEGRRTKRGRRWHPGTVRAVEQRAA